jgi:hypothetical protein
VNRCISFGKFEVVIVRWCVGALHFAKLTLKARVSHGVYISSRELCNIAITFIIDGSEQDGKRVAVLKTHAAAVTHFEYPRELLIERRLIPILWLAGIVAEPLGRLIRYIAHKNSSLVGSNN